MYTSVQYGEFVRKSKRQLAKDKFIGLETCDKSVEIKE
jgi:hypothetical protein